MSDFFGTATGSPFESKPSLASTGSFSKLYSVLAGGDVSANGDNQNNTRNLISPRSGNVSPRFARTMSPSSVARQLTDAPSPTKTTASAAKFSTTLAASNKASISPLKRPVSSSPSRRPVTPSTSTNLPTNKRSISPLVNRYTSPVRRAPTITLSKPAVKNASPARDTRATSPKSSTQNRALSTTRRSSRSLSVELEPSQQQHPVQQHSSKPETKAVPILKYDLHKPSTTRAINMIKGLVSATGTGCANVILSEEQKISKKPWTTNTARNRTSLCVLELRKNALIAKKKNGGIVRVLVLPAGNRTCPTRCTIATSQHPGFGFRNIVENWQIEPPADDGVITEQSITFKDARLEQYLSLSFFGSQDNSHKILKITVLLEAEPNNQSDSSPRRERTTSPARTLSLVPAAKATTSLSSDSISIPSSPTPSLQELASLSPRLPSSPLNNNNNSSSSSKPSAANKKSPQPQEEDVEIEMEIEEEEEEQPKENKSGLQQLLNIAASAGQDEDEELELDAIKSLIQSNPIAQTLPTLFNFQKDVEPATEAVEVKYDDDESGGRRAYKAGYRIADSQHQREIQSSPKELGPSPVAAGSISQENIKLQQRKRKEAKESATSRLMKLAYKEHDSAVLSPPKEEHQDETEATPFPVAEDAAKFSEKQLLASLNNNSALSTKKSTSQKPKVDPVEKFNSIFDEISQLDLSVVLQKREEKKAGCRSAASLPSLQQPQPQPEIETVTETEPELEPETEETPAPADETEKDEGTEMVEEPQPQQLPSAYLLPSILSFIEDARKPPRSPKSPKSPHFLNYSRDSGADVDTSSSMSIVIEDEDLADDDIDKVNAAARKREAEIDFDDATELHEAAHFHSHASTSKNNPISSEDWNAFVQKIKNSSPSVNEEFAVSDESAENRQEYHHQLADEEFVEEEEEDTEQHHTSSAPSGDLMSIIDQWNKETPKKTIISHSYNHSDDNDDEDVSQADGNQEDENELNRSGEDDEKTNFLETEEEPEFSKKEEARGEEYTGTLFSPLSSLRRQLSPTGRPFIFDFKPQSPKAQPMPSKEEPHRVPPMDDEHNEEEKDTEQEEEDEYYVSSDSDVEADNDAHQPSKQSHKVLSETTLIELKQTNASGKPLPSWAHATSSASTVLSQQDESPEKHPKPITFQRYQQKQPSAQPQAPLKIPVSKAHQDHSDKNRDAGWAQIFEMLSKRAMEEQEKQTSNAVVPDSLLKEAEADVDPAEDKNYAHAANATTEEQEDRPQLSIDIENINLSLESHPSEDHDQQIPDPDLEKVEQAAHLNSSDSEPRLAEDEQQQKQQQPDEQPDETQQQQQQQTAEQEVLQVPQQRQQEPDPQPQRELTPEELELQEFQALPNFKQYEMSAIRDVRSHAIFVTFLQRGMTFFKHDYNPKSASNNSKKKSQSQRRVVKFDPQSNSLIITKTGFMGSTKRVPLRDIKWVVYGPYTQALKRKMIRRADDFIPWRCFSIVCAKRTLDFESLTETDCDVFILALQSLIYATIMSHSRMLYSQSQLRFKRLLLRLKTRKMHDGHRSLSDALYEAFMRQAEVSKAAAAAAADAQQQVDDNNNNNSNDSLILIEDNEDIEGEQQVISEPPSCDPQQEQQQHQQKLTSPSTVDVAQQQQQQKKQNVSGPSGLVLENIANRVQ